MSEIGHNSAARRDAIRSIKYQLDDVNSRIAELTEERKQIKGRIKSDLGWKVSDWNAMARLADLEAEPRDQMLDTIREGFEALGVGGQLNMDDFLSGNPRQAPEKPKRGRKPKSQGEQIAEAMLAAQDHLSDGEDEFDPESTIN